MAARVLSIQSHTVHGYVGNKSAVFPLQLLGIEVDFVNSVQFSNHTGYKTFKGTVLQGGELETLIDGLDANSLLEGYTHLLTGYIGSVTFLEKIIFTHQRLKEKNPNLVYVCDPVLGDDGKLYVPKELVEVYKERVIPLASVLTPNSFECELLTGVKIKTKQDAFVACRALHERGVKTVVISSFTDDDEKSIKVVASTKGEGCVCMEVPKLEARFTGTGDLLSALILAWLHRDGDVKEALKKSVLSLQAVIRRTLLHQKKVPRELQLIQSQRELLHPDTAALEYIRQAGKELGEEWKEDWFSYVEEDSSVVDVQE
mmetsp:Transcript_21899/g.56852  ORF Transcript_21899/g.56852 Transcript_21899/m.56852 type:complete len:315 (-) Transcript_21899:266-1210(-)